MAQSGRQMATTGARVGGITLDQSDAVEVARQTLTGRGITPGKDWHVSDAGNCWLVQNLPVVRLLVAKDTGRVLSQETPGR